MTEATTTDQIEVALDKAMLITLTTEITTLKDKLSLALKDLELVRTELSHTQANYIHDTNTISKWVVEFAEDNGVGDEVDEAISSVNEDLHRPLTERKRTYKVTVSGEVRIPFTVEIEGVEIFGHHDDLSDAIHDELDNYLGDYVNDLDLDLSSSEFGDVYVEDYTRE